jgi:LysM repeat protein
MQTDRKIGFAMGILLVGIVAALFFRNEPLASEGVTGGGVVGEFEQLLNQRLRDRQVAVYVDRRVAAGGEAGEPAWTMRDVLKDMHDRQRTLPAPVLPAEETLDGGVRRNNLDGFRTRRVPSVRTSGVAVAASVSSSAAAVGVNSPEVITESVSDPEEPVFDSAVDGIGGVPDAVEPVVADSVQFQPPAEFDEYTVKYGDTLSGIAERTLGAQARYSLIYEANRDRMSNPNQLVPGRVLRIPRPASAAGVR